MQPKLSIKEFRNRAVVITAVFSCFTALVIAGILFAFGILNIGGKSTTTESGSTNDSNSELSVASPTQQVAACFNHQAIDSHTWLEIAKDPTSHIGDCIVVYGEVTQFDSATGTDTFRANIDGTQQIPQYGFVNYPTNTVLTGDSTMLKDVVEKDLFTANATVLGSESYSTQMGGNTTVPQLRVDSIQVTDHLSP